MRLSDRIAGGFWARREAGFTGSGCAGVGVEGDPGTTGGFGRAGAGGGGDAGTTGTKGQLILGRGHMQRGCVNCQAGTDDCYRG